MTKPTVMSLFSGVGGFDLGLERAGFQVVAQCDNDPFANKVLAARWPGVKRYDDVRNVGLGPAQRDECGKQDAAEARQPDAARAGHVDLICGGFPCQDLSVAGKRAGLDGARSGLWFEFYRILSELRPSVALIENVPGLLSSNQGRDFGVILDGLEQLWPGCWGWAVLDSQHFGVAQRRRRLYVIAGPPRERIAQILSLCESGDWNTQARRAAGEDVAATIRGRSSSAGVNEPGRGGEDDANLVSVARSLRAQPNASHRLDSDTYIPDVSPTLSRLDAKGPSSSVDQVALVAHSLRADGFDASEDGTGRGTPLVFTERTRNGERNFEAQEDVSYALTNPGSGGRTHSRQLYDGMGVRRLTPVECERLQGFPDGWTKLDDKTPDGPRYKALGNAVTVPVIEYLGRRIMAVLSSQGKR